MYKNFNAKYKIISKIGEGSFSEVIKVESRKTGVQYAAKRLKKLFRSASDISACAEIKAMMKLNRHPNVLYMIEYVFEPYEGTLTFIFELMDMSMFEFMKLKKRQMTEAKVKFYLFQILKGLHHLHKNGLFHRDVKPENILIKYSSSGNYFYNEIIKLADLGSIRSIFSDNPFTEYISTRWYRSPECLLTNGGYGPKMDVWAAGCVFYEMLTFKPLFPGKNEVDQIAKIHNILGTPNKRILYKFKKKSRFAINFPKQIGRGLYCLLPNISEDGRGLLDLMLQYDPSVRPGVDQILEHRYFNHLRSDNLYMKYRNAGDGYVSPLMQTLASDRSYKKCYSEGSATNISRSLKEKRHMKCKTSLDVCKESSFLRLSSFYTISTPNYPNNIYNINLKQHLKKDIYECDNYGMKPRNLYTRTIQKIDRLRDRNLDKLNFFGGAEEQKCFQSKSFVAPRRVTAEAKFNTVKGIYSSLSSKQNL